MHPVLLHGRLKAAIRMYIQITDSQKAHGGIHYQLITMVTALKKSLITIGISMASGQSSQRVQIPTLILQGIVMEMYLDLPTSNFIKTAM